MNIKSTVGLEVIVVKVASKKRRNFRKLLVFVSAIILILLIAINFLKDKSIAVLNPAGPIAQQQLRLLIIVTLLMLIVVIPVFFMAFWFAYKYRESNKKAKYSPNWDTNKAIETIWWAVPFIIISVLAVMTFQSSHSLDPFKPIQAQNKPLTIQVVALQWKWLFIYPDQEIATVNYAPIPRDTPINFILTSDAPMNSFWVPQLGGQIYAMSGMSTELYLMADDIGDYRGVSANISGEGFASMDFMIQSTTEVDFYQWVAKTKLSKNILTLSEYRNLAQPSKANSNASYTVKDVELYNKILMKYIHPNDVENHPKHLEEQYGH